MRLKGACELGCRSRRSARSDPGRRPRAHDDPGVSDLTAHDSVAQSSVDIAGYPTAGHLRCPWATEWHSNGTEMTKVPESAGQPVRAKAPLGSRPRWSPPRALERTPKVTSRHSSCDLKRCVAPRKASSRCPLLCSPPSGTCSRMGVKYKDVCADHIARWDRSKVTSRLVGPLNDWGRQVQIARAAGSQCNMHDLRPIASW